MLFHVEKEFSFLNIQKSGELVGNKVFLAHLQKKNIL